MSEVRYATFDPNGFSVGGGLLDDADVAIKSAEFRHFTYPGSDKTTTALVLNLEDAEGKLHEQPYSVGDPDKFAPSDDGGKVLLTGTAAAINAKSNFAQFVTSLINAGVSVTLLQTDNIRVIEGMRIHVNAVAQKDKDGKIVKNAKGFDRTVLLASKLISLPGEAPKAAPKAAGKKAAGAPAAATTSAPAASAASPEVADKAVRYITLVATAQGGEVPRSKVSALVFQKAMQDKDADKGALPKLAFDPTFLTENSGRPVQEGDVLYAYEYDEKTQVIKVAA